MKNLKTYIGTILLLAGTVSCSSAYYQSNGNKVYDDLYGTHNQVAIAKKQQAQAELQRAAAEARKAEWEAQLAEAQARASEDAYYDQTGGLVADDYESAYARRLKGFSSPSYRMPSSYYDLRYTNSTALNFAMSYNPAFYNIMISGDQVWVEPKFISSMFGSWGASSYYGNWYYGWGYRPSYAGWGYPRYSWWDWNWSIGYNPWYNSYWGHNYWPSYYPGYYPGHGHHHGHNSNVVHRPSRPSYSSSGNNQGGNRVPTFGSSGNNRGDRVNSGIYQGGN